MITTNFIPIINTKNMNAQPQKTLAQMTQYVAQKYSDTVNTDSIKK